MDSLAVTATTANGGVWIEVRGEVDLANHEQLRTSLDAIELDAARVVHLDLHRLEFCDSRGCQILIGFRDQAVAAGYDVRIEQARPGFLRILAVLALG